MLLSHDDDGLRGIINKAEFYQLPEVLRDEVFSVLVITKTTEDAFYFNAPDEITANHIYEKVKKYQKGAITAVDRKLNMYALSSGVYKEEDIDRIYEIQNGLCYYTGEPITNDPRNFAIDHITPVVDGGSSWPGNLALALKDINRAKLNKSKKQYLAILNKKHDAEWVKSQQAYRKTVDSRRRQIDQSRKKAVSSIIKQMEHRLQEAFPETEIEYTLEKDDPVLFINYTTVRFAPGFLRDKARFTSFAYLQKITQSIIT